ncbi:MAG TPA: hypothetical protein VKV16_07790, partial [Solirubrobacteraceae bacterium]|nr:hypothetical protein [Solirubrobacteraceae bacterium]
MAISPFGLRPALRPRDQRPRERLALAIAAVGIAAILLAYAASPGVRHAVSHATHSVKHAVGNVFHRHHAGPHRHRSHLVQPLPSRSPLRSSRRTPRVAQPRAALAHAARAARAARAAKPLAGGSTTGARAPGPTSASSPSG